MSAVSNTIFNNYLTAYGAPKISKYDTHKKSELRSTYNSIVKANKDAPWYLPVNDQEAKIGAIGLKESARSLRSSLAEVGGLEEDGAFNKKHAASTDPDIISVDYIGDNNTDSVPSFDIEVRQDATNVDTGETEELELDSAIREYFADYNIEFSIQENIIKWKEEKGLKGAQWIMEFVGDEPLYYDYPNPYAGDGWCFPNYLGTDYVVFEGEQVYKTMDDYEYPMDVYYFYQLQNPTAPVVVTVHTNDDNYASTTKPVDQVMTINIA